jgi:hypothetical protein
MSVIEVGGLSTRFGRRVALDAVESRSPPPR